MRDKLQAVGEVTERLLQPATLADMCGAYYAPKPSLEVVYEGV